jgi:hypothetical protein
VLHHLTLRALFFHAIYTQFLNITKQGAFLDKVGVTQPGHSPMPSGNRGCVVVDEEGKVMYAYVSKENGEPHPGIIPPVSEIKKVLGI